MSILWTKDYLPLGIFASFFIFSLICLFVVLPLVRQKKSAALIEYLKADLRFPWSTLEFDFDGTRFRLDRIASGGGTSGVGGSYPVLWCYTSEFQKFIIGNKDSATYTTGAFLFLPPHENFTTQTFECLVGSTDKSLIERVKHILKNDPALAQNAAQLFKAEFANLTIATERHVVAFFIRKKWVLRFTGLSEEIYQNPALLNTQLSTISLLMKKLGAQLEASASQNSRS